MKRIHYFSVAIAKHVFAHAEHGLVFARDPITLTDARSRGMVPILLYSVAAADTAIGWQSFSLASQPLSFSSVLEHAWRVAEGLRGFPDELWVNRHVAAACPEMETQLAAVGVVMKIADGNDKRFAASIRSAQSKVLDLAWRVRETVPMRTIDKLNGDALKYHRDNLDFQLWRVGNTARAEGTERFLDEAPRKLEVEMLDSGPWVQGAWLSSWVAGVPPVRDRYFQSFEGVTWLFSGAAEPTSGENVDQGGESDDYSLIDNATEMAKAMLDAWPNTYSAVAQTLGITEKTLRWYVSDRCELERDVEAALLAMLGVELSKYCDYEASGPCCLLPKTVRGAVRAYDELSRGGDLEFSFEAVPDRGAPDPSWRYMLLRGCGARLVVMMVARGSVVDVNLDAGHFINFTGLRVVAATLYREIQSACSHACANPEANVREIDALERRHIRTWDDFFAW